MSLLLLLNPKQFDVGGVATAAGAWKKKKKPEEREKSTPEIEVENSLTDERVEKLEETTPLVEEARAKLEASPPDPALIKEYQKALLDLYVLRLAIAKEIMAADEEERALMFLLLHL